MKIGLYLNNRKVGDVDLSNPEKGNPGIGGTQFNFITLPYYFQKYFPNKHNFIIYAHNISKLPETLKGKAISNSIDALKHANQDKCDIMIWRPNNEEESIEFIQLSSKLNQKTIAWAHNNPNITTLNKIANANNIKRFVCVSQEQMDRLRDHPIILKTTVIVNGFNISGIEPVSIVPKEKIVLYTGSLVPPKGFHVLSRIWPKIINLHPDAKLKVIGTGKLYDRNQKLGPWGIAEEKYEKQIRYYLSDGKGNIHPSVLFLGLISNDRKNEEITNCKVGVVNPTGKTENCPGSALEFQAFGKPVVSGAFKGLLDTIVHCKTGYLGKNDEDLIKYISELLVDNEKNLTFGRNGRKFVSEKFSFSKVTKLWSSLFSEVYLNIENKIPNISQFPLNDMKYLRELMRILKSNFTAFRYIPSLKEIGEKYW